jgi:hypothetical protein
MRYGGGGGPGGAPGSGGGSGGYGGGPPGTGCAQSGRNITVCPTVVQVIPHANGKTAGASAPAIGTASTAVTSAGRTRWETKFNTPRPVIRRILGRLAIGSAIESFPLCREVIPKLEIGRD